VPGFRVPPDFLEESRSLVSDIDFLHVADIQITIINDFNPELTQPCSQTRNADCRGAHVDPSPARS
jgi:hypothetical protein